MGTARPIRGQDSKPREQRASRSPARPIGCEDKAMGRIRAEFQIGWGGRGSAVFGVRSAFRPVG